MKITIINTRLETAVLGLPPVETFTLTPRALADWNAGCANLTATADRWLRSLNRRPLTFADVRRALSPVLSPLPDPRRILCADARAA